MKRIPQREMRNNSAAILRAAENGEELVITVDGRPVATIGPYRRRRFVPGERVREILRGPTDPTLADDLRKLPDDLRDPWKKR